jgi:hypothetical protein
MSVTINPGTPYVPAVPGVPTTVTATLTLHQALIIAAFDGALASTEALGFYKELHNHPLYDKYKAERERITVRTNAAGKFANLTSGL